MIGGTALKRLSFAFTCAFVLFLSTAFADSQYVQSLKVSLKAEPSMTATETATLQRGDEVTVLETQGAWLKVQKGPATGWVSKLFVNKNKPVGAAALAQEAPTSEAKTSRRRESSYSVSASTRGLLPIERSRSGREAYRSDNEALDAVDHVAPTPNEVQQFIKKGEAGK